MVIKTIGARNDEFLYQFSSNTLKNSATDATINLHMTPYKLPLCAAQTEFEEKHSRFIAQITPASSEEEALTFLRDVRKKHREATHNVYAYRIANEGTPICRHSDDGEPSGTAGMPLLEVFLKQDIYDFCCVATRYFGGTKLGAGGLVRAYARCGSVALEASGIGLMREMILCTAVLPYPLYEPVRHLLDSHDANISGEDFGTEVMLTFSIATEQLPAIKDTITELTAGAVSIQADYSGK
ncbi:MAG: IMPACT family protein [Lachnospiraceae bacterium]|jgi:uncharacterized YigZ family protein|nr:IMPACT family protein [Lachnospiraceae bacterium]